MKKRNILCVDDEKDILTVAKFALELGEFDVETSNSGKSALEAVEHSKPDVILMDVMMPEMDGPTTLTKFREQSDMNDVPIIFMTAKVQPAEIAEYKKIGAFEVIAKPFDPMMLAGMVEKLCQDFERRY